MEIICTETQEYSTSTVCSKYEISSTTDVIQKIQQLPNYQDWIFINTIIIFLLLPVALGFFFSPFNRSKKY